MGFILLTKFKVCCEVLFVISAMSNSCSLGSITVSFFVCLFFFVTLASYLLSGANPHPSLISGTILGFYNKENSTLFVPGIA